MSDSTMTFRTSRLSFFFRAARDRVVQTPDYNIDMGRFLWHKI